MIRTQIQLTAEQEESLRQVVLQTGFSRSEIVRQAIDLWLKQQANQGQQAQKARALAVLGQFSSGVHNISEEHDDYLADAFAQ